MVAEKSSAVLASSLNDAPARRATDKRAHFRHAMWSVSFRVRRPDKKYDTIMLRDLSNTGACGLMCEPIQNGDYLLIEFDGRHRIEAKVRWVRRLLIGLEFTNPLSDAYLEQLRDRCLERAAEQRNALFEQRRDAR